MTPYTPQVPASQGYRASVFGTEVYYLSEADFLKADRAAREYMAQRQPGPTLGGIGGLAGMGSTTGWLRTGANAADAMAGFLNGRDIRRRIDDLDDALADSRSAMIDLDNIERTNTTLAPLIPVLRRLFLAERDATESSVSVLESQLTAVDIQTGAGVAKVASDLFEGSGGTVTGPFDGWADGTGAAAGAWPRSGCRGACVAIGFLVFFVGCALAILTFFRQALRWLELLILLQEAAEPAFGFAVGEGVGDGMVSSWAKDGAANATAAKAAMPAINRRISISPKPLAMRGRCGLAIGKKSM